ncbi:unnamed protein product [Camellia sinensis]
MRYMEKKKTCNKISPIIYFYDKETRKISTQSEETSGEVGRKARRKREDMRQRELLEFRTPQHPSLGANNWGGASPLLARDIPKEALEQRYARLNSVRTRDEIFPAANDDSIYFPQAQAPKLGCPPKPARRGFFAKLIWRPRKMKTITLGSGSKRRRWFPKWDPTNRWPQGWC